MKRIISVFFLNSIIIFAIFLVGCSKKPYQITGNAVKLIAVESKERFSDSITTTNEITFKCSLNYQIGVDKETGDFIFCLKDSKSSFKTLIISCNTEVKEADYYSNEDVLIYKNPKAEKDFIKVDTEYGNKYCSYVIFFIEDNGEMYYAKFLRK